MKLAWTGQSTTAADKLKPPPLWAAAVYSDEGLALGVGGRLAGTLEAGLLALLDARIAGEQAMLP